MEESLNKALKRLVREALASPEQSPQYQQRLHGIYTIAMQSGKLWRESTPYYGDAVSEMWQECFIKLDQYDPNEKEVITWLNDSLRRALDRYKYDEKRSRNRHISHWIDGDGQAIAITEHLPRRPDAEEALQTILDPVLRWIETDPEGTLRQRIFRKKTEVNAQSLLLRYLPPQSQSWSEIAADFDLTTPEAKELPKWYSRYCKPLLKDFGCVSGILQTQDPSGLS